MRGAGVVRVLALVVGLSLCGCEGALNQDGPSPIAPSITPQASTAAIAAGKVLADARGCGGCHSSQAGEYAGSNRGVSGRTVFAPNITSDMSTGLGQWSDQALINAIRYGFDDNSFNCHGCAFGAVSGHFRNPIERHRRIARQDLFKELLLFQILLGRHGLAIAEVVIVIAGSAAHLGRVSVQ